MKNNIEFNIDIIIEEYSNYVFKIIDNTIGKNLTYQDKEEIVSDTFFLLWKNQNKINTNLKAYLSTIARNCSYNKLRKNNPLIQIEEINDFSYKEDYDDIITLKEKLKTLSHSDLEIFTLYYVNGLKINEISKILNKSKSDIKVKLYRIRKKLKEELKNE